MMLGIVSKLSLPEVAMCVGQGLPVCAALRIPRQHTTDAQSRPCMKRAPPNSLPDGKMSREERRGSMTVDSGGPWRSGARVRSAFALLHLSIVLSSVVELRGTYDMCSVVY